MFVLTRRLMIFMLVTLIVMPLAFYAMFASQWSEQTTTFFIVFALFMVGFSGLREFLIRGEDRRHERGSLNFSYAVGASLISFPVMAILLQTVLKDLDFNIWTLVVIYVVLLPIMYFRSKRTVKDFSAKKIFEIETSPRWSERRPFNAPYASLGVFTLITASLFVVTAIQLADVAIAGFHVLDLILVVFTVLMLLAGPYPFMAHQKSRSNPLIPYLYTAVNVILLILGQVFWFRDTPLSDMNHWAALVYFWLVMLSLGLPVMYHKRSFWADNYE